MPDDFEEEKKANLFTGFSIVTACFGLTFGIGGFLYRIFPNSTLWFQYGIGVGVAIVLVLILAFFAYLKAKKGRYHLVNEDKGGEVLISQVKKAKNNILATHFTLEPPSEGYLGILQDRLRTGVKIRRIIYFSKEKTDPCYKWLEKFAMFPDYYTQSTVSCCLPFNIVVIDKRFVWLFLPSDDYDYFRNAVWIENKQMAAYFTCAFDSFAKRYAVSG
jgi:hypothetical protein